MGALRRTASLLAVILLGLSTIFWPESAEAITAPELRGQFAVQEISSDMHGLDLKEKEFLKFKEALAGQPRTSWKTAGSVQTLRQH